jgi:hypothetical protein
VTLPKVQSEEAEIADFEQQDWVRQSAQEENQGQSTKKHVDPNVAFPFQDDFSIGTIHGTNTKTTTPSSLDIIEIQDDKDDISILTTKTAIVQSEVVAGSRFAPTPTPSAARPPTLLHREPQGQDLTIQSAPAWDVEPKVGPSANSQLRSFFNIHGRGE